MEPTPNEKENKDNLNCDWDEADNMNEIEKKVKDLKIQNYTSREFTEELLKSILKSGSNHGLTGLQNLGNTCFMNSALQCLSNSVDLTYYFLTKTFLTEINSENPLSQGGKIAKNYYKLLDNLWNGNSRSFAPSELKSAIARIAPQFAGYGQQDSHELLSFLLDGLHEDLNKISKKPYADIKEKDPNETDEVAAKRFWDFHKLRNDSIIVDLFNGQYRSTITCPDCHRVSITYDPYLSVSLTIPKRVKKEIYVIPRINIHRTIRLCIYVAHESLFFDIGTYINKHLVEPLAKFRCMEVKNNVVENLIKVTDKISKIEDGSFVFCCEVNPKMLQKDYFTMTLHLWDLEENDFFCYPRMMTILPTQTVRDLKAYVYAFMRRYIKLPDELKEVGSKYDRIIEIYTKEKTLNSDDYDEVVREEFDLIFSDNSPIDKEVRRKFIYSLPFNAFVDVNGKPQYVFSYDEANNGERTIFNDDDKLENIIDLIKRKHRFNIGLFKKSDIFTETLGQLKTCLTTKEKAKDLTLADCLDHFKITEKLDKSNEWYCNQCKQHKQAHKKMDLFYTPKLLILTLKRFEYQTYGTRYYRTYAEKITDSIDFPVDELDLKPWVVGPQTPNPVYELYAVSQHFGSTGGGHYTACCKNFGKWYNFNDSSVSNVDGRGISNSASYLLFYRRKDN